MVRWRLPSVLGLFLTFLLVWPSLSFADDGKVGINFTGPGAAKLRRNVVDSLPRGLRDDDLNAAEKKAAKTAGKAKGKKKKTAIKALGKAGKKAGHAAVVVGVIKKKRVNLVVVDAKNGSVLLEETVLVGDAPGGIATALESVASRFGASEEPVAVEPKKDDEEPAAEEPTGDDSPSEEPVASKDDDDDKGSDDTSGSVETSVAAASPFIVAGAGVVVGGRNLTYANRKNNVAEYELFGAFQVDVGLLIQPFHKKAGILGKMGVTASFRTAIGLNSEATDGSELGTQWYEWQVGLRQRFGSMAQHVALDLGYGIQHFEIDFPEDGQLYPSASYGYLRIGADGRYPIGKLAIIGGGGVRLVLAQEGFTESFGGGDAKAFGFDVGVGVTYALGKKLEARATFDLQQYATTLDSEATDEFTADSATDQMLGAGLGITYMF
jgi:hypothetical protein